MITVYGLRNCDALAKKALKWLDMEESNEFRDFRNEDRSKGIGCLV